MIDKYLGKRLDGRYEIQELLGVGGMAMVYRAYDNIEDRTVAVKILKDEWLGNEDFCRRFKNESKAIAVLSHPNIVKVYDVSFGDLIQYIVMEYVDGISLKEYISQQKVIRWQEAVHFTLQILRAVQHAHEKGIIHRDLKPQNIMLLADGTIKVTDFGIARFSKNEQRTMTDQAIGSVHYISPEQAKGEFTDGKTDVYSVGVMLYEMTTGSLPFEADSAVSVAIMQLQNDPINPRKLNASIPEGLEQITLNAMQKDTFNRYQSAQAMLADLEEFKLNPAITFDYDSSTTFMDNSSSTIGMVEEPTRFLNPNEIKMGASAATGGVAVGRYRPSIDLRTEEDDEDAGRKSPIIPILAGITAAFIIVLLIVVFFWLKNDSNTGNGVPCPDVKGLQFTVAQERYPDFDIIEATTQYSTEHAAGEIISQIPVPNKELKNDRTIKVVVSLGKKSITLENYTELSLATVSTKLKNLGFTYTTEEIYNDSIASGYVVKTDPPAETSVEEGTNIVIFVSKGPSPKKVEVPLLKGLKLDKATEKITEYGLTLGEVKYEPNSQYPTGYVISQNLTAYTEVSKSTPVNLVVSSGKAVSITVTNLPIQDQPFQLTVWYNNQNAFTSGKISTKGKTPETASTIISLTRDMFSLDVKKITVSIKKGEDTALADYSVDFENGTASLIKQIYKYPASDSSQSAGTSNNPNTQE